jgi:nucleoid-associated protein YgaU
MNRMLVTLFGATLLLSMVGCNKNPDMATQNTDPYATAAPPPAGDPYAAAYPAGTTYGGGGYTATATTTTTTGGGGYYATASTAAPTGGGGMYTVQRGDTLYAIARKVYGDQSRWRDIYAANQGTIGDPNQLNVGMNLILP